MSETDFYNYQTVLDAVASRCDEFVNHLFPQARRGAGCYRVGGIDGERGDSLSISTKPNNAGSFFDHADHSCKGNAIGLWAMRHNLSYQEAGKELAQFLGVSPEVRLHTPKKRPAPKIQQAERTFQCGGRTINILPLSTRSAQYALSRGITAETLRAARCASTDTDIILPHFDEDDKLVLVKTWSCDGQKRIFTNDDPVPVLFGKHLVDPLKTGATLIICEGQWDALTWQQLGHPAVSIPSGVSNDDWIGEDWSFLNCFSAIFLDFDDDAPGREAESRVRVRLGHDRCRSIHYRFKDANAALQAGEEQVLHDAFEHALNAPVERIVNPADVKEKTRNRLNRTHQQSGVPFFLPALNFEFRPHEITIWFGVTGHGKSSLLSNQIAYAASLGHVSMVASFEQDTPMTIAAMLQQYTANPDIGSSSEFETAYDDLTSRVLFFDSMERTNPDELIASMTTAHRQLGVTHWVVDNGMTLDVDRQDNTAQAETAHKFRSFAARHPGHLHIVLHPRKPPAQEAAKPPSVADIMGASEWSSIAHNIICVWRDVSKAQRLSEMRDEQMDPVEILAFDETNPDGKVFVRKQRDSGDLSMISYRFDKRSKRAWKNPEDLASYYFTEESPAPAADDTPEDGPF